jgi:hypothetical protein
METKNEKLMELVRQINTYDGSLESMEAQEFDDSFFNTYFKNNPAEAVRATFFGNIQNWTDDYIRFNGYGNLESLSEYDYEKELEENEKEIIERAEELQDEDEQIKEALNEYKEEIN